MNRFLANLSKAALGLIIASTAVSCNQNTAPATTTGPDSTKAVAEQAKETIVYVDADTLSDKYEYFKDIKTKIDAKIKKADTDLQSKGQAFQREVAEYQQKGANMSATERQATEERLARKQQELAQLEQNAAKAIDQDHATESKAVYSAITEYLKKHAEENGYKYVLTYSKTTPSVLYADPALDITKEVIEALNKEYAATKGSTKK